LFAFVDDSVRPTPLRVRRLWQEAVPVLYQDPALAQLREQRGWHQVEGLVIVVRVLRSQYLESVLDREVRTDDEHRGGEAHVRRPAAPVAERPRDEHRHDHGLAAPRGHLAAVTNEGPSVVERRVDQPRIPVRCRLHERRPLAFHQAREVLWRERRLPLELTARGEDLGDVDDGLGRFPLAEEEPPRQILPRPVTQELLRHLFCARIARLAPAFDVGPEQVDQRELVPLFFGQKIELSGPGSPSRVVVARGPTARSTRRQLPWAVVDPVFRRLLVGRTKNGLLDRLNGLGLPGSGDGSRAWFGWATGAHSFRIAAICRRRSGILRVTTSQTSS